MHSGVGCPFKREWLALLREPRHLGGQGVFHKAGEDGADPAGRTPVGHDLFSG